MSNNPLTQFTNCRLLRDHRLTKVDLWVRDGRIVNPEKVFFDEQRLADRTVDCGGAIVSAGFIDLQINGNIYIEDGLYKCLVMVCGHFGRWLRL